MVEVQQWGRGARKSRRETARQLAKEIMQQHSSPRGKRKWDVGWFLAICLALGVLLIAPKVGRTVTAVVLVLMFGCLIIPICKLDFVNVPPTRLRRGLRVSVVFLVSIALLALFGLYVWPPINRHPLSAKERTSFQEALKAEKGGDANLEVHIACPTGDEQTCVFASQFISLFGAAGWQVLPSVEHVVASRPANGITVYRRAGDKEYMSKHWDAGGFVAINEAHLLAVQKAFQTIHIEIEAGADPDLRENVMGIYIGPERENEAEPTHLTRTTEWVTGKRTGSFPQQ